MIVPKNLSKAVTPGSGVPSKTNTSGLNTNQHSIQFSTQRIGEQHPHAMNVGGCDTPVMRSGLVPNTEARLSELPSAYGNNNNNDVKTMPGTMSNTKRNSMAHNILNAEKSGGANGSGIKQQEKRTGVARNTTANDTLRPNKN